MPNEAWFVLMLYQNALRPTDKTLWTPLENMAGQPGLLFIKSAFMMLSLGPTNVAPCQLINDTIAQSLIGPCHNNGLRHFTYSPFFVNMQLL
jgi:hypothetical protein